MEVDKLGREDDATAALAVIALVAGADGDIEAAEAAMCTEYVAKAAVFQGMNRDWLAKTLDDCFTKSINPILRDDLVDMLKGIADEPETAVKVMKAGLAVAGADGEFEPEEKEVLIEACEAMGLKPTAFKQLR